VPAGAGLALAATPERYDAFIDRDGAGAAVRGTHGRLVIVGRPSSFVAEQWLRADGDARLASDPSLREGVRCDRVGCVVTMADGRALALVQDPRAFEEDCRRAAAVVSRLTAPPSCKAALVLDRHALQAGGATALRLAGAGFEIWTARGPGEPRPWERIVRAPRAPPPRPSAEPDEEEPAPAADEWR
jgi:competence protein ComEC